MSINHYSTETQEATTLWWTQQQQPQPSIPINHHAWLNSHAPRFNLNDDEETEDDDVSTSVTATSPEQQQGEEDDDDDATKEAMFEKPLTPSDVGKLNRLVIPKQHAERYFPLGGGDSADSKGLVLSFEDESGKCWRFRYSYWNSSQSYVLTKGWSRYVKDKRLDAGDVVFFQRHRNDAQRLFIRWRRRHHNTPPPAHLSTNRDGNNIINRNSNNGNNNPPVPVGWTATFYPAHTPYPAHHSLPYQPESLHAGGGSQGQVGQNQTTPPMGNSSSSRVLRLFGVNMECQPDNDSQTCKPESSYNVSSTQGTNTHPFYHHHQSPYTSTNPHHHMVRQQPY